MKTQRIKKVSVLIIALLIVAGTNLYAQQGRGGAPQGRNFERNDLCQMIPDLTEDQEAKIKDLRVNHLKEMNTFRNEMNELRAKKHTLMTTDNTNMNEINSVIDQMTSIHNKMMKVSAKHRQDVRGLLTEEQKVIFDSRPMHRRGNRGYGHKGRGARNFDCYGQGNGQGLGYGRGYSRWDNLDN